MMGSLEIVSQLHSVGGEAVFLGINSEGRQGIVHVVRAAEQRTPGQLDALRAMFRSLHDWEAAGVLLPFEFGIAPGTGFFRLFPHVEGRTLLQESFDRKQRNEPFTPESVWSWLRPIGRALHAGHSAGRVHGALSHSHVFIGGRPSNTRLLDFGLLPLILDEASRRNPLRDGWIWSCWAPEFWRGETLTPAADQYSLAALVYGALASQMLIREQNVEHARTTAINGVTPRNKSISPAILTVLSRALSLDPAGRFTDCQAFLAAFESAAQLAAVGQRTAAEVRRPEPLTTPTPPSGQPTSATDLPVGLLIPSTPESQAAAAEAAPATNEPTIIAPGETFVFEWDDLISVVAEFPPRVAPVHDPSAASELPVGPELPAYENAPPVPITAPSPQLAATVPSSLITSPSTLHNRTDAAQVDPPPTTAATQSTAAKAEPAIVSAAIPPAKRRHSVLPVVVALVLVAAPLIAFGITRWPKKRITIASTSSTASPGQNAAQPAARPPATDSDALREDRLKALRAAADGLETTGAGEASPIGLKRIADNLSKAFAIRHEAPAAEFEALCNSIQRDIDALKTLSEEAHAFSPKLVAAKALLEPAAGTREGLIKKYNGECWAGIEKAVATAEQSAKNNDFATATKQLSAIASLVEEGETPARLAAAAVLPPDEGLDVLAPLVASSDPDARARALFNQLIGKSPNWWNAKIAAMLRESSHEDRVFIETELATITQDQPELRAAHFQEAFTAATRADADARPVCYERIIETATKIPKGAETIRAAVTAAAKIPSTDAATLARLAAYALLLKDTNSFDELMAHALASPDDDYDVTFNTFGVLQRFGYDPLFGSKLVDALEPNKYCVGKSSLTLDAAVVANFEVYEKLVSEIQPKLDGLAGAEREFVEANLDSAAILLQRPLPGSESETASSPASQRIVSLYRGIELAKKNETAASLADLKTIPSIERQRVQLVRAVVASVLASASRPEPADIWKFVCALPCDLDRVVALAWLTSNKQPVPAALPKLNFAEFAAPANAKQYSGKLQSSTGSPPIKIRVTLLTGGDQKLLGMVEYPDLKVSRSVTADLVRGGMILTETEQLGTGASSVEPEITDDDDFRSNGRAMFGGRSRPKRSDEDNDKTTSTIPDAIGFPGRYSMIQVRPAVKSEGKPGELWAGLMATNIGQVYSFTLDKVEDASDKQLAAITRERMRPFVRHALATTPKMGIRLWDAQVKIVVNIFGGHQDIVKSAIADVNSCLRARDDKPIIRLELSSHALEEGKTTSEDRPPPLSIFIHFRGSEAHRGYANRLYDLKDWPVNASHYCAPLDLYYNRRSGDYRAANDSSITNSVIMIDPDQFPDERLAHVVRFEMLRALGIGVKGPYPHEVDSVLSASNFSEDVKPRAALTNLDKQLVRFVYGNALPSHSIEEIMSAFADKWDLSAPPSDLKKKTAVSAKSK